MVQQSPHAAGDNSCARRCSSCSGAQLLRLVVVAAAALLRRGRMLLQAVRQEGEVPVCEG